MICRRNSRQKFDLADAEFALFNTRLEMRSNVAEQGHVAYGQHQGQSQYPK